MVEEKKKKSSKKEVPAQSVPSEKKESKPASKKNVGNGLYTPKMKRVYKDKIVKSMMGRFHYESIMQVPKLEKITLNMGIGDGKTDKKALESAVKELTLISGQKSVITKAKKDVSNFKIRKGNPVGVMVTLRSTRMFEFLERLNAIALPRTRDFNGLSFKSFDGRGNYNFGINEQIIFTEIDYDKIDAIRGMDIAITTTAQTDDEAYYLLKEFGFPLRKKPIKEKDGN
jgi:large subunit ribosomal protein L5